MTMSLSRREFLARSAAAGCAAALPVPLRVPRGRLGAVRSLELDAIVRGGRIVDGTGRPAFAADLGIAGGLIAAVGDDLGDAKAPREIDARGLVVAPGFIDVHAHSSLMRSPRGESKLTQGVTLDVTGPDGSSPFPRRAAGSADGVIADADDCSSFDHWARRYHGTGLHLGSWVGHGTVRSLVLGPTPRAPDARELRLMQELVRRALAEGALGLSSGLEYNPAGFAKTPEVIALAEVAAEFERPYVTHVRNEDSALLEAIDEAILIARESGAPLLLSHLKVGGKPNWHKIDALLERIEKARESGLDVRCDRYPYEAWSTTLAINFPGWATEGGKFKARLAEQAERLRMKAETLANVDANGGWGVLMIAGGVADEALIGRRLDAVAKDRGVDPFDLACDLLAAGDVSIIGFGMSEANTDRIIALPYCMIASDGSALPVTGGPGGHPRSFGTFPRAIRRCVRDKKLVSLEEMVRKMTSLPASTLKLQDRGVLAAGKVADVVVFDAEKIEDKATHTEPRQLATGVQCLLVGGQLAIDDGRPTGALAGRIVRAVAR